MRFPSVALSLQLEQPALILRHEQVDQGGRRGAADRVRTALLTQAMIVERARARGGSEREYMAGNLLGLEVTAAGVAQAFNLLALAGKTSAAVVTVDGGNTAAAVP